MIKIGIVGHRFLGTAQTINFVTKECTFILQQAQREYKKVIALSAIAEGSDTIFAEAASVLNIPLHIVRPFKHYITDFATPLTKDRYLNLQKNAKEEIQLPYTTRSEEAYSEAMQWVLKNSDLLIAVWDGKKTNTKAGTAAAIKQAIQDNSTLIHLDVVSLSKKIYPAIN